MLQVAAILPLTVSLMGASDGYRISIDERSLAPAETGVRAAPDPSSIVADDAVVGPIVSGPVTPTVSLPLRDLAAAGSSSLAAAADFSEANPRQLWGLGSAPEDNTAANDSLAATSVNLSQTPGALFTTEGIGNLSSVLPPDTNGDVGPNHYVQTVNSSWVQVFNKNGAAATQPSALRLLWPGGSNCGNSTRGDPVVVYDHLADRWLLSQLSISGTFGICVAVSQTADPAGLYHSYEFTYTTFPDYFKIGVWPDGYYVSTNEFQVPTYGAAVLERARMLLGQPATIIKFTGVNNFMLPSDLDGATTPPAGSPNFFYTFKDSATHGGASDRLEVREFHADFVTPGSSTFTLAAPITISGFAYTVCGFGIRSCIPQGGITQTLDAVSEWPMFRAPYRNFGDHQSLLGNFTVDAGSDRAGIRWFELRRVGTGAWSLFQEGTYAPADGKHRWMGSIAMDKNGGIAVGYSLSSATDFPSMAVAARQSTDPLGTLASESVVYAGGGSQSHSSHRWGDYSAMTVDPVDGCTFWYTNEYYPSTSVGPSWHTRIATLRLPGCLSTTADLAITKTGPAVAASGSTVVYTLSVTNNGPSALGVQTTTMTNAATLNIGPSIGQISSTINMAGAAGLVQKALVKLHGFSHTFPADVDALLLAPSGASSLLLSDTGGTVDAVGLNLAFDDATSSLLPCSNVGLASGTYHTTDCEGGSGETDMFAAPAPVLTSTTGLGVFVGGSPNGAWRLFERDDADIDAGTLNSGWSLTVVTGDPLLSAGVVVTDTLPAGTTFVAGGGGGWLCGPSGGLVVCRLPFLAVGAAPPLGITVTAACVTNPITNTAVVTSAIPDLAPGNNSALFTTDAPVYGVQVGPAASLRLGDAGATVTHTLSVTNTGNVADVYTATIGTHVYTTTAPATVGAVAPCASQPLNVAVNVPPGALVGDSDIVSVTLTSQGNPAQQATAALTTTVPLKVYLPSVMKN